MRNYSWYKMAVLAYYRCEWTDVGEDDEEYMICFTQELNHLLKRCYRQKTKVPNAAKEVSIFLAIIGEIK